MFLFESNHVHQYIYSKVARSKGQKQLCSPNGILHGNKSFYNHGSEGSEDERFGNVIPKNDELKV